MLAAPAGDDVKGPHKPIAMVLPAPAPVLSAAGKIDPFGKVTAAGLGFVKAAPDNFCGSSATGACTAAVVAAAGAACCSPDGSESAGCGPGVAVAGTACCRTGGVLSAGNILASPEAWTGPVKAPALEGPEDDLASWMEAGVTGGSGAAE
ncbi:MAG: hypothetical protein WC299_13000 [Kiritimatiellia bacterium]